MLIGSFLLTVNSPQSNTEIFKKDTQYTVNLKRARMEYNK